jgi:hypothetical protein
MQAVIADVVAHLEQAGARIVPVQDGERRFHCDESAGARREHDAIAAKGTRAIRGQSPGGEHDERRLAVQRADEEQHREEPASLGHERKHARDEEEHRRHVAGVVKGETAAAWVREAPRGPSTTPGATGKPGARRLASRWMHADAPTKQSPPPAEAKPSVGHELRKDRHDHVRRQGSGPVLNGVGA